MDKTEISYPPWLLLASNPKYLLHLRRYATTRSLRRPQIEAAACIIVAAIFALGVFMNRTIGVVADSFHPKLDEAIVLLGDIARHDPL
jgi:hypothetical protein